MLDINNLATATGRRRLGGGRPQNVNNIALKYVYYSELPTYPSCVSEGINNPVENNNIIGCARGGCIEPVVRHGEFDNMLCLGTSGIRISFFFFFLNRNDLQSVINTVVDLSPK